MIRWLVPLALAAAVVGDVANADILLAPCENASTFTPSSSSQYWVSTSGTLPGDDRESSGGAPCSSTPQPCKDTPGHTFCESDPSPGQCQRPSVKTCPPCPKGLTGGVLRNPYKCDAPWSKTGTCLQCADTSQVCQSNCQSDGDCGYTFNGTRRHCSPPGRGGLHCLPCNGPLACAPGAALTSDWCGDDPISPARGLVGSAGQRWDFVAHAGGGIQIKSILSITAGAAGGGEQCLTADSFSVIVEACDPIPAANSSQLWTNQTGQLSPLSAPGLCIDSSYHAPDSDAPLPFRNASLGAEARAADLASRLTLEEAVGLLGSGNDGVPRLSAPGIPTGEALHGVNAKCTKPGQTTKGKKIKSLCPTSFPSQLSVGATFNKERKRSFFCHFYMKMLILPRQARNKHRETSKKRRVFSCRSCLSKSER